VISVNRDIHNDSFMRLRHISFMLHSLVVYRELFVKDDGSMVTEGDLLVNKKLANTFRRIAFDPMTFYTGSLAREIVDDIQEYGQ